MRLWNTLQVIKEIQGANTKNPLHAPTHPVFQDRQTDRQADSTIVLHGKKEFNY